MAVGSPDYVKSVKLLGVKTDGKTKEVLLDVAGRIVAVMIGEGPSGSIVLRTDDEGRIIAVITDPENIWGIRPLVGNAELAVRLGSPNRWDRRGSVIWQNSFQDGFTHSGTLASVEDGSVKISADHALTGGYSAKLVSPAGVGEYARVIDYVPLPTYGGKVGLEVHFSTGSPTGTVEMWITVLTGSRIMSAGLKAVLEDQKVYYYNSAEGDTDTEKIVGACGYEYYWHGLKVVIDLTTEKYLRALVEESQVNLTDVPLYADGNLNPPRAHVGVNLYTPVGDAQQTIHVDDIIVTVNEPDNE